MRAKPSARTASRRLRLLLEEKARRARRPRLDFSAPVDWKLVADGELAPHRRDDGERLVWFPQEGSQRRFLEIGDHEVLFEGTRGPGKTDALLFDFLQFVGRDFGADWKGILFRRTFPELADVIAKSKKWIPLIFPDAEYNEGQHEWKWPSGETLRFAHMSRPDDYWKYHGHAYPWIGWEELTTWATPECYLLMFSCNRSTNPRIPKRVRATTNPYGVGHNWVKTRFQLPIPEDRIVGDVIESVDEKGKPLPDRRSVHGSLHENLILLAADPNYEDRIRASAQNPQQADAWIKGSWDIVSGGMLDDVWQPKYHVIDPPIPWELLLKKAPGWRIDRSYDDGQSKPFSVGWWAQSNGEPIEWNGRALGAVRGDVFRIAEWYGWNGQENQGVRMASRDIAKEITRLETLWGLRGERPVGGKMVKWSRCRPGPADSSIWNTDPSDSATSVASEMTKHGVNWEPADKSPGSRKQGWKLIRDMLRAAVPDAEGRREQPGVFVNATCKHFLRTVPVLPRDDKDLDDVDTEAEDHVADETRYRLRRPRVVETITHHLVF